MCGIVQKENLRRPSDRRECAPRERIAQCDGQANLPHGNGQLVMLNQQKISAGLEHESPRQQQRPEKTVRALDWNGVSEFPKSY